MSAALAGALVAASHAFFAPERPLVDTALRAVASACLAFGLLMLLLHALPDEPGED